VFLDWYTSVIGLVHLCSLTGLLVFLDRYTSGFFTGTLLFLDWYTGDLGLVH
jgi:hypothetical protein